MEFLRSFLRRHLARKPVVAFSQAIRAQEHTDYVIITVQNRGHCLSFPALRGRLILVMRIAKKKKEKGANSFLRRFPTHCYSKLLRVTSVFLAPTFIFQKVLSVSSVLLFTDGQR